MHAGRRGRCPARGHVRQVWPVLLLACAWGTVLLSAVGAAAAAADERAVIQPRLASLLAGKGPNDTVRVIVALREQADLNSVWGQPANVIAALKAAADHGQKPLRPFLEQQRAIGAVRGYRTFWIFDGIAVECNKAVVEALASRPEVESIQEDFRIQIPPVGPAQGDENRASPQAPGAVGGNGSGAQVGAAEWNIERVRAPEVWAAGVTGAGVVVGSIDTGVDYTHPDLATNWRGYPDNPVGNWFDAVSGQPMPYDDHGHGTHTTGTILGGDASGAGIGVAPGATWIAAKAFDAGGSGSVSSITVSMEWMMDPNGDSDPADAPRVVNNSWGNDNQYDTTFLPQVEAWVAAGIFPSFASGNNGYAGPGSAGTPGNFAVSFSVGATDSSDIICDFSSRGPAPDGPPWYGMIKPNVSAPGRDVLSAVPGGYYSWEGTSMATPHVTGAVALLLEANPSLTVADLESALTSTAVDLGDPGPDNDYGAGRIDCYEAVSQYAYPNRIAGHVQAWDGTPLIGAAVTITDGVTIITITTDGFGDFSRTVPDGTWTVSCAEPDYTFVPPSETVTVPPDATSLLFIGSAAPGGISGTVTLESVTSTLVESPHPVPTDWDNTWVISGGGSKIRAHFQYCQVSDCQTIVEIYDQYDQWVTAYAGSQFGFWTPWVAGPLLKVRILTTCSLDPGFVIDSYAVDDGTPLADVSITLSPGGRTTTTSADGTFAIAGLAPTTYTVTPSKARQTFDPTYRREVVSAGLVTTGVDFLASRMPPYSVLLYDAYVYTGTAREALGRLGYAFASSTQSDFNAKLVSQPWNAVVVDCPSGKPAGGWAPLIDYINAGGKVALSTWYLTAEPDLCAAFGVSAQESLYWVPPIYRWDPTHPLFARPQTVPDLLYWSEFYWNLDADRLTVTSADAQAIAGFSMYAEPDTAALVVGNSDRTIMNGFLWDDGAQDADGNGIRDCTELVMNEVQFLLARRLEVGRVGGLPGAPVTIPVSLSETEGVAGLQFDLEYLPPLGLPLTLTGVRAVGPISGWVLEWNEVVPGQRVRVMAYSPDTSELPAGSSTLFELDFQISPVATGERFVLCPINAILANGAGENVEPVTTWDGEVAVLPSYYAFSTVDTPQGGDLSSPLPFSVRIEAVDGAGGLMTGYSAAAEVTSSDGHAEPATIAFTGGAWEGDAAIFAGLPADDCFLEAVDQGYPSVTGQTNPFDLRTKGDPTGDGSVDVLDVVRTVNLALRAPVPEPPRGGFQVWAADANCSGLVNVQDVILVLRKSLGLSLAAVSTRAVSPVGLQTSTRHKGGDLEVVVRVKDAADLAGLQLTLAYDPNLLQLSGVSTGSLTAGWALTSQSGSGKVEVLSYDPAVGGVTGTGSVAILTFRIVAKGHATVVLSEATLSDSGGQVLPIRGGR